MLIDDLYKIKTRLAWLVHGYGWLSYKEVSELTFWREELESILLWMDGTPHPHSSVPPPGDDQKVTGNDRTVNAVLTWMQTKCPRYPERLGLPPIP